MAFNHVHKLVFCFKNLNSTSQLYQKLSNQNRHIKNIDPTRIKIEKPFLNLSNQKVSPIYDHGDQIDLNG